MTTIKATTKQQEVHEFDMKLPAYWKNKNKVMRIIKRDSEIIKDEISDWETINECAANINDHSCSSIDVSGYDPATKAEFMEQVDKLIQRIELIVNEETELKDEAIIMTKTIVPTVEPNSP